MEAVGSKRQARQVLLLAAVAVTALALLLAGCGGGSNTVAPTGLVPSNSAPMSIKVGDAPSDSIVDFEITINQITLTDSSNNPVTVLSQPTRVELTHTAGTVEPVSIMNVPAGTYTKATITVSNPEVKIINSSGQVQELTATLASNTATVTFSPNLVVTAGTPISLSFDFDLAASVSISGTTATITPTFTATSMQVPNNEAEQEDKDGEMEDIDGTVTGVSAPMFTITVEQSSQSLTFTTNSNTQFEGVSGLSGLSSGMIVEVDAVTQPDGSLLATKVEVEENAQGMEAEGLVTSVTGSPATQFQIVVQDEAGSGSNLPPLGNTLTVNVTNSTVFRIDQSDNLDLGGLNVVFDASHLAKAQSVEADTNTSSTTTITADKVKLKQQGITGVVSNFQQIDSSHASFTLTPAVDSAFDRLTGLTSLTVLTQSKTKLDGITSITNGATVRVRGPLFFSSGAYTQVAAKVGKP